MRTRQTVTVLPARPADGHKGTFGTVWVVGGQAGQAGETGGPGGRVMIGGPALSALAALRVGCGLAVLAVPEPLMTAALTIAPSATGLPLPVDPRGRLRPSEVAAALDDHVSGRGCLAVGPGLGAGPAQQQVMVRLVCNNLEVPMVIDADGLNALAAVSSFDRDLRADVVLTPHPGEFRRLAAALGLRTDELDRPDGRVRGAESLAQRLGCVVVLKGAGTVVTDGVETSVNESGNVALATAGTGDVLTGVISGLVSQFHRFPAPSEAGTTAPAERSNERARSGRPDEFGGPYQSEAGADGPAERSSERARSGPPDEFGGPYQSEAGADGPAERSNKLQPLSLLQCARLGVHLHGLAADRWAARHGHAGLLAADLLDELPAAMQTLRDRPGQRS